MKKENGSGWESCGPHGEAEEDKFIVEDNFSPVMPLGAISQNKKNPSWQGAVVRQEDNGGESNSRTREENTEKRTREQDNKKRGHREGEGVRERKVAYQRERESESEIDG